MAAITIANRVAQEHGTAVGSVVGYSVRFDAKISKGTSVKYCTDGVLVRETLSDPLLSAYSVVIVDEAHERSLHSDILLGILKKIRRKRPDLRIIVTSATMNAQSIKDFFETNVCSMLSTC
jgi:ATP-dependent RNA helicase DDX35